MIILFSFKELTEYITAVRDDKLKLLVVEGRGGTSKTFTIKKLLSEKKYLLLNSHATPASMYEQLYYNTDVPVFINDIDRLLDNRTTLAILKQLCETSTTKTIQYNSKTPLMSDLPRQFTTRSSVIIDTNDLGKLKKGVRAFLTRGVHVKFSPTNDELLTLLSSYADDKEIVKYLYKVVSKKGMIDLRKYEVAKQLSTAGIDWKNYLRVECCSDTVVASALSIDDSLPYEERVVEWQKLTGKSGRSYDRTLATLRGPSTTRGRRGANTSTSEGSAVGGMR